MKNTYFLERSNRGHQMFFSVLSIMPCTTAVNDFLGVLCATFGVSCSTKCSTIWTQNFFVSLLSSIDFNVTTICVLCYDHFHVSQCFVIITFHWFVGLISNIHKTI